MNILLSNPPWTKKGPYYAVRAGSRWPHFENDDFDYMPFPFFLAHATSLLEHNGYEPKLIDSLALKQSREDFLKEVDKFQPKLVVMEISSFSMKSDLELAALIKKSHPDSIIAFAGLANEMKEEEFVRNSNNVDYCLVGEYEETLLDLIRSIEADKEPIGMAGLTFIQKDGKFSGFTRRSLNGSIDDYPWPSRDQLPMENYHDEPGNIPLPSVQMWASRGCPYKCIFCAWPQIMYGNNDYRSRNIIDLADEFEWLVTECGYKSVYFDDDTFNVNKKRIREFCNELIKRGIKVPWAAMCRADLVDESLLKVMKKSGVKAVKYGLESADQTAVDQMQKRLDLKKAIENIRLTHNHGIKTHLTFMFGLPGETRESCQATLDLALDLNPESLQLTVASPFPGSVFMKQLKETGHLVKDVTDADGMRTSCVRTEAMSHEELEDFVAHAQNEWMIHVSKRNRVKTPVANQKDPLVSVIIPNFNGEAFLRNAVHSIVHQTWKNTEIIVVDNNSSDKSISIIKNEFPDVKVMSLNSNTGFAAAVNTGVRVAQGDYISFFNNDAQAKPNWIETLINAIKNEDEIGFAASRVLSQHDTRLIDSAGDGITSSGKCFNIGNANLDSPQFSKQRWVFGATGAASFYKKTALLEAGELDEDFYMYLEDVDLSFRLQTLGYKCLYVPEAVVTHIGSATANSYPGLKTYYLSRNLISLLVKNVPKSLIKLNFIPFLGHLFYMFFYQLLINREPVSFVRGLYHGIQMIESNIRKRKIILGGRRITDEEYLNIFHFGDVNYKLTKKMRQSAPSSKHIEITKARVESA
ncbi:MAG: glycosyltransferase [Candidatus Cloacimonetes bacterium]|nr:glycosyltransferase [Candidatus Cloacimonadota bacterium]